MAEQVFVDGIRTISMVNGVLRLECVVASGRTEQGQPEYEHTQTLLMSVPSFVQSFNEMERMVQKLTERGVLKDSRGSRATDGNG